MTTNYIDVTIDESVPGSGKTYRAIDEAVKKKGRYLLTSPENAEAAIPDPGAEVAKKPKRRRKMTRMQRSIRKLNKQTADNRRLKEWRENLEQRARAPKKAED